MKEPASSVVIIGCGPAGIAASLFLAKEKIPHVILEKETYPRDKVCGDGCSGKTTFVLKKANPEFVKEIFSDTENFLPSYGILFSAPNQKAIEVPYAPASKISSDYPPGFTSRRLVLDNFLFEKIDKQFATVMQDATVKNIEKTGDDFEISYIHSGDNKKMTASHIIAADGDKGVARKHFLQNQSVAKTAYIGLRAYYKNVSGLHKRQFIELHFIKNLLPGYFWIFPLPNGDANVGICMPSKLVRDKKINLREKMLQVIHEHPGLAERFIHATLEDKIYGWGLPMSKGVSKISDDGVLFAGDAASLIDPFSGEGIGNALYSGMMAAEAIKKSLHSGKKNAAYFKENYDDVLFSKIGSELKLSYTMQRLVKFPFLFNLIVNKAAKSPLLQQTISSMFADLDMRSLLRRPSFYWKILTNQ